MKQYLDLISTIKEKGTYKPAARENMPGTQSLFGYQFRHDLQEGFPLLTTKKMYWKGIVVELLWFLTGDTNIKFLVDNGVNIWNEDAYQYYLKIRKPWLDSKSENSPEQILLQKPLSFEDFILGVKTQNENDSQFGIGYKYGDCGYQYGKMWRDWDNFYFDNYGGTFSCGWKQDKSIDQIKNVINSLRNNPESRRHIVTAIDPAHDTQLALYWCHAMFQFNCRPMSFIERNRIAQKMGLLTVGDRLNEDGTVMIKEGVILYNEEKYKEFVKSTGYIEDMSSTSEKYFEYFKVPKYYLDCQLYQRSMDTVLGAPYNIASYSLLTHIISKMCNMIPGDFIHSVGDAHIYENHQEVVKEQLTREPKKLPTLKLSNDLDWNLSIDDVLKQIKTLGWDQVIFLENYTSHPSLKAILSTGLIKT